MTKTESKVIDFIKKHILLFLLVAVTIIAIALRACGMDFKSDDFNSFLNPWWSVIQLNDFNGLATQVGNYNIPYQIIIYLMTLLPLKSLYAYKIVSIIFDFVLAFSSAALVYSVAKGNKQLKAAITYSAVLLSATVIFNSSFWAQCDSIYTSFIILAILFLHKDKPILSFVFLGIAFAFKLQTIFIFPVLLYYWIATKKISILHFFIIPAVDVIMCLPEIIMGRPFADIVTIYAEQTDYGKLIQMNCPNFYALMCDGNDMTYYYLFKQFSVLLTIAVLGIMMCIIVYKKVDLKNIETFLLTSAWTVFTCIMFLSSMHERYGYLLDIILIVYAVVSAKRLWIPIVSTLISLRGYCYYLFSYELISLKVTAVIYTALYVYVTFLLVKTIFKSNSKDTHKLTVASATTK